MLLVLISSHYWTAQPPKLDVSVLRHGRVRSGRLRSHAKLDHYTIHILIEDLSPRCIMSVRERVLDIHEGAVL